MQWDMAEVVYSPTKLYSKTKACLPFPYLLLRADIQLAGTILEVMSEIGTLGTAEPLGREIY